jgi:DnaJ-class molecular chaperone
MAFQSVEELNGRKLTRSERSTMTPKIKEHTCPACNGTGFPVVMQPVQPGRKIYPVQCKTCQGKGKIRDAD